jgi:hypothetical protein
MVGWVSWVVAVAAAGACSSVHLEDFVGDYKISPGAPCASPVSLVGVKPIVVGARPDRIELTNCLVPPASSAENVPPLVLALAGDDLVGDFAWCDYPRVSEPQQNPLATAHVLQLRISLSDGNSLTIRWAERSQALTTPSCMLEELKAMPAPPPIVFTATGL